MWLISDQTNTIMVSDNQPDQYFQLVKDKLLEKVISEPLNHSACHAT